MSTPTSSSSTRSSRSATPSSSAAARDKFAEFRAQGKTIVIVTHALSTVKEMCDEAALLEHGRLQVVGNSVDVVDRYLGDVFAQRRTRRRDADAAPTIWRVQLLDPAGSPIDSASTGDAVTMRFHYSLPAAASPIRRSTVVDPQPRRPRGVAAGCPTLDAARRRGAAEGTVDLHVDHLLLLPGSYDVAAADRRFRGPPARAPTARARSRIVVERRDHAEEHGVVSLGGRGSSPARR